MIGYPTKKSKSRTVASIPLNAKSHQKKGMSLEDDINISNEYYAAMDIALIHKKPTPVQIVQVDYPRRSKAKIVEAYFKLPSTTDYNGIYKGLPIDFEAKQISLKTLFPLKDIHLHQIEHLRKVWLHGGVGFLILRFTQHDETYLIDARKVIAQYDDPGIRSLTYVWVKQEGHLIRQGLYPRLHYLEIVDTLYVRGGNSWQTNEK